MHRLIRIPFLGYLKLSFAMGLCWGFVVSLFFWLLLWLKIHPVHLTLFGWRTEGISAAIISTIFFPWLFGIIFVLFNTVLYLPFCLILRFLGGLKIRDSQLKKKED